MRENTSDMNRYGFLKLSSLIVSYLIYSITKGFSFSSWLISLALLFLLFITEHEEVSKTVNVDETDFVTMCQIANVLQLSEIVLEFFSLEKLFLCA